MPWLVCTQGDDQGAAYELRSHGLVVGRQAACDIQLIHSKASSKHCSVRLKGDRLEVEDLNSSNGIKYKGKRIKSKTITIKFDEQFGIGDDVFKFCKEHDTYVDASGAVANDLKNKKKHKQIVADYSKEASSEPRKKRGLLSRLFGKD